MSLKVNALSFESDASARVPAYKITELNSYEPEKVYYGEHSEQALNG